MVTIRARIADMEGIHIKVQTELARTYTMKNLVNFIRTLRIYAVTFQTVRVEGKWRNTLRG